MTISTFIRNSLVFMLFLFIHDGYSQTIELNDIHKITSVKNNAVYFEDKTGRFTVNDAFISNGFKPITSDIPNFGISSSAFWIKLKIKNNTQQTGFLFQIAQPGLDEVELYQRDEKNGYTVYKAGEYLPFSMRQFFDPTYIFKLDFAKGVEKELYIKVKARDNIQLPIFIGTEEKILEESKVKDILMGIYLGVMLAMLFYNAFIYITVKDKGYLYYIIYSAAVLLVQAGIQGYAFQYLWPNSTFLAGYSSFIFPPISGIAGLYMMRQFLSTSAYLPKINIAYPLFIVAYSVEVF